MADLRGEQLKDSYQNVVTRGTGNKLENGNGVEFADLDDKASLSGADFTDMPFVDGSPIVERGSNSDGEWVRWADGTQIAIRELTNTEVENTSESFDTTDFDFPVNFSQRPRPLSQSADAASTVTFTPSRNARNNFYFTCRSTTRWNARLDSAISSATPQIITAFGTWK